MVTESDSLESIRAALASMPTDPDDRGELSVETGLVYGRADPVQVRVRPRGRRYDITEGERRTARS